MNILLVQAYLGGSEPPVFPLGLSCLASSLTGHNVKVFDPNVSVNPFTEMADILEDFRPNVVGISLRNIDSTNKRKVVFYYKYLKKMLDVIKDGSCRDSRIIVGGSGFSMFAQEIMEDEQRIDIGILLEGEITFQNFLQNLDTPEKVRSVFFRKDGKIIFTGHGVQIDLNNADFPDRRIIQLDRYKKIPEAIGIETKRGCIYNCIYCIYGFLNGKALRLRKPEKVVDEIERLVKEYGVDRFTFVDSVFNVPFGHAEEICKEIIRRKIKVNWSAWFNEKDLSSEFIELARDAGCNNVILSPDGFSDETLKKLGKNIKKEDILKSYKTLKCIKDIELSYNFFKNPPGQTLIAFLSMIIFCIKSKMEIKQKVHFEFNSLRIEPHTTLFRLALEEGIIKEDQNLLYPVYYTNRRTAYIDFLLNGVLSIIGK